MPRLFHRPPKYRLHKSTNQAVVSLFGETIYLGPFGSRRSHSQYQEVLTQWEKRRHVERPITQLEDADESSKTDPEKIAASITPATLLAKVKSGVPVTISELILVYRSHTRQYYRKNGEITREAGAIDDVLRLLRRHHGNEFAQDFGPLALDELREKMIDEMDWSRGYLNKQVNRLRGMFKWAVSKELIEGSVSIALRELAGLKKGRTRARETAPVVSVPDSIIDATLKHLPKVVADMVRIQRLTSARPGEVCSMAPVDIDSSGDVWIYRPSEHKTEHFEKDRVIAIGPRAIAILTPYMDRSDDEFCFSPRESERRRREAATKRRKTSPKAGNRPGTNRVASPKRKASNRYVTDSYRRAIHRVCDNHNIEKWSPNRIRHTASTEIRKRFGIDAARAVDGHGSTSTTEIYAELDLDKAVEVMRQVG
ncbi:tyrosine-type recombinase/integrase [Novipirellula artificiosorum]|uniref:Site-specific tyrosine recombinase XerC n=1 Tax=Novipirellula artificiosorum TaxID=2528016 RepID=A0A5C6DG15_9BACT|nr:site-specific integrase [Novipirellula artificiosorum]TWU34924.1 site-specific tyrosine recombinase XerC [Novipirellula artificiosorum]